MDWQDAAPPTHRYGAHTKARSPFAHTAADHDRWRLPNHIAESGAQRLNRVP